MSRNKNAVQKLMDHALSDFDSSWAAVAVLLSAYEPSSYPLDISVLGKLDYENLSAAMMVISLRVWNNKPPQELIANGRAQFEYLVELWGRHLDSRSFFRS